LALVLLLALFLPPQFVRFLRNGYARLNLTSLMPRFLREHLIAPGSVSYKNLDRESGGQSQRSNPLISLFRRLRPPRKDELGREQGQALVRSVNSVLVLGYMLIAQFPKSSEDRLPGWFHFGASFIAVSILILVLTL